MQTDACTRALKKKSRQGLRFSRSLVRRARLWCDVLALLAAIDQEKRKTREEEHVTFACIASTASSEDDDSGEALTVTVVVIISSSTLAHTHAQSYIIEEREELIILFSLSTITMDHGTRAASAVIIIVALARTWLFEFGLVARSLATGIVRNPYRQDHIVGNDTSIVAIHGADWRWAFAEGEWQNA